jgi:hypothetical protein
LKTNILEKITRSIHSKKISKPLAVCISALFVISMISMLATSQAQTNPLTGQYWITPVPADQSTGRVTQTQITGGVSGSIPGDCYGAYPTIADKTGNWDLTATPILSFDISINEFWQGDLQDHTGLSVIIVDQTHNAWNPSDESACDLSTTYGHAATSTDGSIMRVANSAAPTHYTIDLRTLVVPLSHISQLVWSIRPGMKGVTVNYQITNIQVSDSATTAPAPTTTPAPTASPTPTQTPKPTASPTAIPTPSPEPTGTNGSTYAADLNCDSKVDFNDIKAFVADYLAYSSPSRTYTSAADFNQDGKINFQDIQLFVQYYVTSAQRIPP